MKLQSYFCVVFTTIQESKIIGTKNTTNLLIFCSAIKTIENIFHEIKRNENYHSCAKYAGRQFQGAMRLVYKYGDAVFVREGMWQIMRLRARLYHSFGYEKILVPS